MLEQQRNQPQPQQQRENQPLTKMSGKQQPAHKFDPLANQSFQEKTLSAFIDAISTIPRISLSRARIAEILEGRPCKCETAYAGTVLMRQDEVSSVVIYLATGSVSVVHDGEKRASIQAPAMVGHHSFIYNRARTAAIICESDVAYFLVALDELLSAANVPLAVPRPAWDAGLTRSAAAPTVVDSVDIGHAPSRQSPQMLKEMLFDSHNASAVPVFSSAGNLNSAIRYIAPDAFKATSNVSPSAGEKGLTSHPPPAESLAQSNIRSVSSGVLLSHPIVHPSSAPPPSFSSAGRGPAGTGMSVTDSLGMMMRQHDV
jgi:hypothetical protein